MANNAKTVSPMTRPVLERGGLPVRIQTKLRYKQAVLSTSMNKTLFMVCAHVISARVSLQYRGSVGDNEADTEKKSLMVLLCNTLKSNVSYLLFKACGLTENIQ
jgi:hypothetical protein